MLPFNCLSYDLIKCLILYAFLQIDGLCKLLNQNSESLTSLEFIHCKLSSDSINAICSSLPTKNVQTHGIKNFSINTSNFLETNPVSLPLGLVSFLTSGRYVYFSNIRHHSNPSICWLVELSAQKLTNVENKYRVACLICKYHVVSLICKYQVA